MKIPAYLLVILLMFAVLLTGFFLLLCDDRASTGSHYFPPDGFPKESVIAEFGDTTPVEGFRTLGVPFNYSRFLDETNSDVEPYYFPNGPIIGYGYGLEGKVVVMHYYDWPVNRTMIDEMYSHIAAKGKAYGFESIPCLVVSSKMMDVRAGVSTLPPGSPQFGILFRSFGLKFPDIE
ncbi:MAG: hypothetical protein WC342_06400 [Methanoregula sp.]|jgi:hypothetical protein